jgi:hypothetical protein
MRADMPDVTYSTDRTASIINFILGIWVLISPFVLGVMHFRVAVWNNVIVGIIVIAFAANRTWGGSRRSTWTSWVNFALGIWLIISPWVVGFRTSPALTWNNVIVGIVVAIVSAVGATRRTSAVEPPVAP